MGEVIAFISLTAAIPQLIKYGIGFVGEISRISTSVRSASRSLQESEDQLHLSLSLIAELEAQDISLNTPIHNILLRCKDEADAVTGLLQALHIVEGNGKITRMRKVMKSIQKKKYVEHRLSAISQRLLVISHLSGYIHHVSIREKIQQLEAQWSPTTYMTLHDSEEANLFRALHLQKDSIGPQERVLRMISTLPEPMSNCAIILLAEMSCFGSHEIPARHLTSFLKAGHFLSEYGIITPGVSPGRFYMDPTTSALVRAELKSMPKFPKYMEILLRLADSTFPVDFESKFAFQQDSSYSCHVISALGILIELCPEGQLSRSNFDIAISITSRVTRFLADTGSHVTAKEVTQSVLDWGSNKFSSDLLASSTIRSRLAVAERYAGCLQEAERIEREVLWLQAHVLGENHVETLHSLNNYALTLTARGNFADAERAHLLALSAKEKMFGPHHPETLITVTNLARCLQALGRHGVAKDLFQRALSGRLARFKLDHPAVLRSISNLGESFCHQRRYKEAEKLHRTCLSRREKILGSCHLETIRSKGNLAFALNYLGRSVEAEILFREVTLSVDDLVGLNQPEAIKTLQNLARFLRDQRRYQEAETVFLACLLRVDQRFGELQHLTLNIWRNLVIVLHSQEKYLEALGFAVRVRDVRIELFGYESSDTRDSIQYVEQLEDYVQQSFCTDSSGMRSLSEGGLS